MITDGRVLAEDTFIDEGTITRPSTSPAVLDETTGVSTPAAPTTVYTGRCRVKKASQIEREQMWGDTVVTAVRRIVNVPYTAAEIRIDDVFTPTSSLDPELLRTTMRVSAIGSTSTLMFRQVGVEVVE